jgi:BirA family biotin operon repressor/biotin-[acetyl-CoA-carboxylase] ligase
MTPARSFWHVLPFDCLPSTNRYIKEHWASLPDRTVVWALFQTEGRGRLNRSWISERGGLWISFLFKDFVHPPDILQMLIGLGTAKSLESSFPENRFLLKWPNDIYIQGKKIAGILQENLYEPDLSACIIGLGININNPLPSELSAQATTLSQIVGTPLDLTQSLRTILDDLEWQWVNQDAGRLLHEWLEYSWIQPGMVVHIREEIKKQTFVGTVVEVTPTMITLQGDDRKTHAFVAGDIHILNIQT